MQPEELRERIQWFTNVSAALSHSEVNQCYRTASAICALCRSSAATALLRERGRPVMLVYICDGWSAKVRSDSSASLVGGHVVRRQGHFRHEFLLERALLRTRSITGIEGLHMIFGAPRGLKLGKGAWNILTASADFHPLLRALGHEGLSATVYIQDGALFSASLPLSGEARLVL